VPPWPPAPAEPPAPAIPPEPPELPELLELLELTVPPQSAIGVNMQPLCASHASSVQGSPSTHALALPAHTPNAHASLNVHALPSSQAVVFGT
jgi:hypothetical protein